MKRSVLVGLLCLASALAGNVSAQDTTSSNSKLRPAVLKRLEGEEQAYKAFLSGDYVGGTAALENVTVKGSKAAAVDLQVGSAMAIASFRMLNEKASSNAGISARQVATLAISKLTSIHGSIPNGQKAQALALAAQAAEVVLRDSVQAKQYYQAALQFSPKNRSAIAGLRQITAIEQEAKAKAEANKLLAERARGQTTAKP